jgi:hypothetical protein
MADIGEADTTRRRIRNKLLAYQLAYVNQCTNAGALNIDVSDILPETKQKLKACGYYHESGYGDLSTYKFDTSVDGVSRQLDNGPLYGCCLAGATLCLGSGFVLCCAAYK